MRKAAGEIPGSHCTEAVSCQNNPVFVDAIRLETFDEEFIETVGRPGTIGKLRTNHDKREIGLLPEKGRWSVSPKLLQIVASQTAPVEPEDHRPLPALIRVVASRKKKEVAPRLTFSRDGCFGGHFRRTFICTGSEREPQYKEDERCLR
jgi:hypothetical protein